MAFVKLAREDDIPAGRTLFVRAGVSPVLLVNYEGAIRAFYTVVQDRFGIGVLDGLSRLF